MNATEFELDASLRSMLDQHLDAIEQVLTESGLSRAERRNICDEVEAQATEILWQRAEGNRPTPQLMAAVIAELDTPEAYHDVEVPNLSAKPRELAPPVTLHMFAFWALMTAFLGFIILITPMGYLAAQYRFVWLGLLFVLSLVLSSIAVRDIWHRPDRFYGVPIAVSGTAAFPLLLFNWLAMDKGPPSLFFAMILSAVVLVVICRYCSPPQTNSNEI